MKSRRMRVIATAGLLTVVLSGCAISQGDNSGDPAGQPTSDELTLAEAKAHTIEIRDEMAALYPAKDIL